MKIERAIDFLISLSKSPVLLSLVNRYAVNKNRIQRERLIAAVIKYLLVDYGRDGMLGDISVFEAKSLQLMHDNIILRRLKGRAEGATGERRNNLKQSINNIEQRLETLRKVEGPDTLRFLSDLYLKDIAPDFNPAFLILFRAVAKRLFNNFVNSIRAVESAPGTINEVRRLSGNEPVFFIANHISNADHLPILFALNRARLISPVVIGGSNLYSGISGKILPKLNVCQLKRDDMIEKKSNGSAIQSTLKPSNNITSICGSTMSPTSSTPKVGVPAVAKSLNLKSASSKMSLNSLKVLTAVFILFRFPSLTPAFQKICP